MDIEQQCLAGISISVIAVRVLLDLCAQVLNTMLVCGFSELQPVCVSDILSENAEFEDVILQSHNTEKFFKG